MAKQRPGNDLEQIFDETERLLARGPVRLFESPNLAPKDSLQPHIAGLVSSIQVLLPSLRRFVSAIPEELHRGTSEFISSIRNIRNAIQLLENYNKGGPEDKERADLRSRTVKSFQDSYTSVLQTWSGIITVAILDEISEKKLGGAEKRLEDLANSREKAQNAAIKQQGNSIRKQLQQYVETQISDRQKSLKSDPESIKVQIQVLVNEFIEERYTSINDQQRRIEEQEERLKETLGATGVAQHSKAFRDLALGHRKTAGRWLVATASAALLLLCVVAALFMISQANGGALSQQTASIERILLKGALLSVLVTASLVCLRQYSAHTHNSLVYMHRSAALDAFRAFASASPDEETRGAVLRQATAAIFAGRETGFSKGDGAGTQPVILEVLRNLTQTAQPNRK